MGVIAFVYVQDVKLALWVNKPEADNLPTDRKFHLPIILHHLPCSVSTSIPLSHWLCRQYGADERSWQLTSLDQYQLISMSGERRKEQGIDWEKGRERMSEKVTKRKSQFDPIRLLGVWRCKWDDWPVIAGLMLGNQSHSGLDINKHPSNCPFFVLIPPPLPGPAWTLTNNTTTTRAEQWCHLKKPQGGWIDSLALAARAKRKHACLVVLFVLGRSSLILFFYFPFFSPSSPPGRGACRCWWWYNTTVRCLWPIPCHLDFCVNPSCIFLFFSFYILLFTARSSFFFRVSFSFAQITFPVSSQTPQLLVLYGYWWKLFCVNATLLLAQLVNTT